MPLETNIKNLQSMVLTETKKLKASEPLEPWHPVKSGMIEDTDMMLMASKKRKKDEDEDDEDSPKRKVKEFIFERDNLEKLCWDDDDD